MHIALVNNQSQFGGAETVLNQLRAGLMRAGHAASVHIADAKTYPRHVRPLYPRFLSRLNHSRLHRPVEYMFPRTVWTDRQFRKLAEFPCDVIHLHNFHGRYASIESLAFLARLKPLLWTFHALWGVTGGCDHPGECARYKDRCGRCPQLGRWPVGAEDKTAEQLELKCRHLAPVPIHVVAPSRHIASTIKGSRVGKNWTVHHIPNGVDHQRFNPARKMEPALRSELGLAPSPPVILVVNRNFKDPQKGHACVEEALLGLPFGSFQLVLIGHESSWAASRLPGPSQALGYLRCPDKLARYYEAADYFLFASPAETFPCVILEAMAAGCCIVSTPTNGVLEQIEHQRTGWLAQNLSGASLGVTLEQALARPAQSRELGLAARAAAEERFSETRMISSHLDLYWQIARASRCESAPISPLTTALAP